MEYCVHIMLGSDFKELLPRFKRYIERNATINVASYIKAFHFCLDEEKQHLNIYEARPKKNLSYTPGLDSLFNCELSLLDHISNSGNNESNIQLFFKDLFRQFVNLEKLQKAKYGSLRLFFYVPLYDKQYWSYTQKILNHTLSIDERFLIDIIGIPSDLSYLFTSKYQALEPNAIDKELVNKIIDFKELHHTKVRNFILLQNSNKLGYSLNLNLDLFIGIIGELACLWVEHYNEYFIGHSEIKGVGLSMVSFDKYYFIQYLLSQTYLELMEKAGIDEDKINVNDLSYTINQLLSDKQKLASEFWDTQIRPMLSTNSSPEGINPNISSAVDSQITQLIENISKKLECFLYENESKYSLPKKKALLARLLGLDDELFDGNQFIQEQLIIDDLHSEGCEAFIKMNNTLLDNEEVCSYAVLSKNGEPIKYRLPDIKKLRDDMRISASFIRRQEETIHQLSVQINDAIEADKRLTDDGNFIYEGKRYQLLPNVIEEFPLSEDYKPKAGILKSNIDLRSNFTRIKNQGGQGACTAFTLVGIFEYILKANKKLESNLSESFVYYNARKRQNKEMVDSGISLTDTIFSLQEHGCCKASIFPYNEKVFDVVPDSEAYMDGKKNVLVKALNVHGAESIKSAISEGYPVAISLKIFNSFGTGPAGFIYRPTEDEIQSQEYGNHAMIVCGYSESEKIFVVRNSWGTSFGDKGYCYISYSYLDDVALLNGAYIVTEITTKAVYDTNLFGKIDFDITDANIYYAITKNQLNEEKLLLSEMKNTDSKWNKEYLELVSKLRHPRTRKNLVTGKLSYLNKLKSNYQKELSSFQEERLSQVHRFEAQTRKGIVYLFIGLIIAILMLILPYFYINSDNYFTSSYSQTFYLILCLISGGLFLWWGVQSRKKKILKKDQDTIASQLTESIYEVTKKINKTGLYYHIIGEILEKTFNIEDTLKKRYHVLESYLGNLKTWKKEEETRNPNINDITQPPFFSIISNKDLDVFFDNNKNQIIGDKCLSNFISSYGLKEDKIIAFREQLKEDIIEILSTQISQFDILKYAVHNQDTAYGLYKYLKSEPINNLLSKIDSNSSVFLKLSSTDLNSNKSHKVIIGYDSSDDNKKKWINMHGAYFSIKPSSLFSSNPFKILVSTVENLKKEELYFYSKN